MKKAAHENLRRQQMLPRHVPWHFWNRACNDWSVIPPCMDFLVKGEPHLDEALSSNLRPNPIALDLWTRVDPGNLEIVA